MAFISVNINQYDNEEELLFNIHNMTAQFLETVHVYTQNPPDEQNSHILQPRRNNISVARMNMKTDAYSVLQMSHHGFPEALSSLAKKRSLNALTPQANHPEEYPFPIAMDLANYALKKFDAMDKKNSPVNAAYTLARQVSGSFEAENLETWINFVKAAQTMAWGGYRPPQILDAATEGSSNPFIKAMGHMLAEITGITPDPQENIIGGYNPFIQNELNVIEHQRSIEETFEMVLIHAMEADSHLPMIHVANNQNEGLLKGRFSGWCAHSLQSAAQAYKTANQRGMPRDQAARLEFQSAKQQTDWENLTELGGFVTDRHRNGEMVTLTEISKWCEDNPQYKSIMESINMTLADPAYNRKLEANVEMPSPGPQVSANHAQAAPKGPQFAPQPGMMPPTPGLGGGMGGGMTIPMGGTHTQQPQETESPFEE